MNAGIHAGCHVYGRRGRYIGIVEQVNDELMRVRGTALRQVYYVPLEAVVGLLPGGGEVFIGPTWDEMDGTGWLLPPHGLGERA